MEFKFDIGDTVFGVTRQGFVTKYRVLSRKYEEDAVGSRATYEVCKPTNTGSTTDLAEEQLYADKEVAVNVLIEEEKQRHEDRIREIYSFAE
jgi:hypothetical protein